MFEAIFKPLKAFFEVANIDESHGYAHARRVLNLAIAAAKHTEFSQKKCQLIGYAALLHDVDDRKFFQTDNYANARDMCQNYTDLDDNDISTIIEMIKLVSCSTNGNDCSVGIDESEEGEACLWKLYPRFADRLDAIGKIGIERCIQYSLHVGRPLFDENTPRPKTREGVLAAATPERFANYLIKKDSNTTFDHFYDKLLHIADLPTTNPYLLAKAQKRKNEMIDYLISQF